MRRTWKVPAAEHQVRDGYVWCHDSWRPVEVCIGRCYRNENKCSIYKVYKEAQTNGQDMEKGKNNKGKRHKGKR